jgi:hypothetical protein
MKPIQLPIFVKLRDCGDVVRYDSIPKMQGYFEQIDVENQEYEAWDATGTPLRLSVQKSSDWLRIEPGKRSEPEHLAIAIREFARLQGVDVDIVRLQAGDFTGALEQVTSAVRAKWQSKSWWQRFKRRF